MLGVSDLSLTVGTRGTCGLVAASSESLLDRFDIAQVTREEGVEIAQSPQSQTSSPTSCRGSAL